MSIVLKILAYTVSLIVLLSVAAFWKMDGFKTIEPYNIGRCEIIKGTGSAEDITIDRDANIAFISLEDRMSKVRGDYKGNGSIAVYDLTRPAKTFSASPIGQLDEFHPHGLSLIQKPTGERRLFVINHRNAQDTIEVFDIDKSHRLRHIKTLTDPLFVSLNDLVAVGWDTLYIGSDSGGAKGFMKRLETMGLVNDSNILFHKDGKTSIVVDGYPSAGGITASHDGKHIFISGTSSKTIEVYAADASSGELTHQQSLALQMGVDNLDIAADGSIWAAGHPKIIALIQHFISQGEKNAPSQVVRVPVTNGQLGAPQNIFTSLGGDLSASSVAVEHRGKFYIGGITPAKMLACDAKG